MQPYQRDFLELALARNALRFGEFTLKSGRVSPYFFNAGLFDSGAALAALGRAYARAAIESGTPFDMLFGPAYKGIALAAATAMALAEHHGRDLPVAFNRKEAKSHGEGGVLIGAPLRGRVLIVDDVITAGTAIRESIALIRGNGATAGRRPDRPGSPGTGRQVGTFRGPGGNTAEFGIPVMAIAHLTELLALTQERAELNGIRPALLAYRREFGAGST